MKIKYGILVLWLWPVIAMAQAFTPVWESPYNPMTFYVMTATVNDEDLQVGDEIGIFDIDPGSETEICVGAGVLDEVLGGGVYLEMIASMDDGSNPDQANGFTPGNDFIIRLYSQTLGMIEVVEYSFPYSGYDEVFTAQGNTIVDLHGTPAPLEPFQPVWESPYNPMTFYITGAQLDEIDLMAGDQIGIFDLDPNDGEEICVGAATLSDPVSPEEYLEMIASMDDGSLPDQANGFTPGNAFIFKFISQDVLLVEEVVYTFPYPGYDEVFTAQGNTILNLFGTTGQPGPPNWEPVPYLQYNMQIIGQVQYPDGTISLNENDIVAAFVDDECRGVISPNPEINGLLFLTVGSNQQAGETITFKAYIAETGEVVDLNQSLVFENQKQTGTIPDPFIFSWSDMISQIIQLDQGWSGISSYVIPDDASMENIFVPIQNELVILQNFEGMYWPTNGVNTIGNWDDHAGYQVKMETAQQVTFSGSMQENLTANLVEGWNYLPVLNTCDNDADELFSQITGNLQIVKEVAGYGVYWPQFGINTLGAVQPGKAYFVMVDADVSLEFPQCTKSDSHTTPSDSPSRGRTTQRTGSSNEKVNRAGQRAGTPLSSRRGAGTEAKPRVCSSAARQGEVKRTPFSHTIAFPFEVSNGLAEGSIISIYNQMGSCCGAAMYQNHNLVLTAFGDDPTTPQVDGLVQGEPLRFRITDPETGNSSPLKLEFDYNLPNGENFVAHGLSAVKSMTVNDVDGLNEKRTSISIYPNPSKDVFNVETDGANSLNWELTDIHGSVIATGRDQSDDFSIDISNHPKGIYYLKIMQGGLQVVRKLVLQ